jgi:hypothetical protein
MKPSLHERAKAAVADMAAYSDAGFPGATLEQLAAMTSKEPEWDAARARLRAERNVELLLAGCWEIRAELDASGIAPQYRQAVYMERMGVKKGRAAYKLMETPNKSAPKRVMKSVT